MLANKLCPCESGLMYVECCNRYISGDEKPPSPEALMRSRYSAYTIADIPYIKRTMAGKALAGFDECSAKDWAHSVAWLGLTVLKSGLSDDDPNHGWVEFVASFKQGENMLANMHERSEFRCENGQWLYIDGEQMDA